MRIAFVVTGGFDRSGRDRVIPVLLSLVERLTRDHAVVVYVLRYLDAPATYPLRGATVHDLGRPEGMRRQYVALVNALERDAPFDVIHGHWALPSGLVACLAGRRLGIPSVVTMDSGEFVGLPDIDYGAELRLRQRLAVRLAGRLADRVVVCTSYQAGLARQKGRRPIVVPLGVDTGLFSPATPADGPPWRLLHVGSLNPVKDQDTLLRAIRLLCDRGLDVHLDSVGEDRRRGVVQALAAELALDGRVTFHGFVANDALVPFYQRAHLFVLPSRHEAAGIVVLEAAASGVPVAGTAVGHIADWAPERARAVPVRDHAALAAAIETLLRNPEQRLALASAARAWTEAHDAEWSARQLEKIYWELRS